MKHISATKAPSSASTTPPVDKQDFRNVQQMLAGGYVRRNRAASGGHHLPVGAHANRLPQGRFGRSSFPVARGLPMGHPVQQSPAARLAAVARNLPAQLNASNRLQAAGNGLLQDVKHARLSRVLSHPLLTVANFAVKFVTRLIQPSKA